MGYFVIEQPVRFHVRSAQGRSEKLLLIGRLFESQSLRRDV